MGDGALAVFYESALGGGEVDCVGEDGARGEEGVGVVDVGVGGVGGEEGVDEGDFRRVLGDVGLDGEVGGGCEVA